jgi:hypothetical protein
MKLKSEKQKTKNNVKFHFKKGETLTNNNTFSNKEIGILSVYLLGGEFKYIDTEDIAVKANELAPGRFLWRKYGNQINMEVVRKRLSDAKTDGDLLGSYSKGWILSEKGLQYAKEHIEALKNIDLSRAPMNKREMTLHHREKERMLASIAYEKVISNECDYITPKEAEDFFRVDDYVTGAARREKLTRIINTFGDDLELSQAIKILSEKVRKL